MKGNFKINVEIKFIPDEGSPEVSADGFTVETLNHELQKVADRYVFQIERDIRASLMKMYEKITQ